MRAIDSKELGEHRSEESCWMAIDGSVYDLTEFLSKHPGGKAIILKHSGKDATAIFKTYHPLSLLSILPSTAKIGSFTGGSSDSAFSASSLPPQEVVPLGHVLNSYDFARAARKRLSKEAWDYLVSAADDEVTYRENESSFNRIWIRPRVLVDVSGPIDTSATLLGSKSSVPIFISATAMGGLYHPDGEVELCRGAGRSGIIQMCPTLASRSIEDMASARAVNQAQWYQLYVNPDRRVNEEIVRKAERLGFQALVITVDVTVLGKRERDQRNKVSDVSNVQKSIGEKADQSRGVSRALSSFIYPGLDWEMVRWFRSITKLPILLKGIQTGEDAVLAARSGLVAGIIVSNHGGRQVDFSRPTIDCLVEVLGALKKVASVNVNFDVYVDGGIRRGTDVFKCLALGAKAVGIGRPAMFALASHGQEGVHHLIDLLTEELRVVMMHTGCRRIADISNAHISVDARGPARFDAGFHESKL